jgi:hypothetical protein
MSGHPATQLTTAPFDAKANLAGIPGVTFGEQNADDRPRRHMSAHDRCELPWAPESVDT